MHTHFSRNTLLLSLLALMLLVSCSSRETRHQEGNISILRFDQLLFETPAAQLADSLQAFQNRFRSPLLTIYADDPQFMQQMQGFLGDSIVRDIYRITKQRYPQLYWLEATVTEALKQAAKANPDIQIDHVAAYVSCQFDYTRRVVVDRESHSALISIDQYAVGDMERYNYFGLPLFIVERCDSALMAVDLMSEVARAYIASPDEASLTMLDLMVAEGKVLYFLDQVLQVPDHQKIRYTPDQLEWAKRNESRIWSYFIQNNLLYEKDHSRYHNFVDEAPKTNAFKDSAPRTTDYIGWQIVKSYMKNNRCTMKALFENSDAQAILQASGYRPQDS